MTSRQLKALRRRQASEASRRAGAQITRHERLTVEADDLGLLNEAIYHANKAEYWRERQRIVSQPQYHALRRRDARGAPDPSTRT